MALGKTIFFIVLFWVIYRIIQFFSKINITSSGVKKSKKNTSRLAGLDIQDADYEDVD